jgi:hypothetical protein
MRLFLLIITVLSASALGLSVEANGGYLYGYDGYGAHNDPTFNVSGGVMHSIDYLLDLAIRSGYSQGNVRDTGGTYNLLNACVGIDAHSIFGTRNPFVGLGVGYYRVRDIYLNPGTMERFGGYVFFDARGQVGGHNSPFDIDLRLETHFIPDINNTSTSFIKGETQDFTSAKVAREVTTVYQQTMVYIVLSLGIRFKFI